MIFFSAFSYIFLYHYWEFGILYHRCLFGWSFIHTIPHATVRGESTCNDDNDGKIALLLLSKVDFLLLVLFLSHSHAFNQTTTKGVSIKINWTQMHSRVFFSVLSTKKTCTMHIWTFQIGYRDATVFQMVHTLYFVQISLCVLVVIIVCLWVGEWMGCVKVVLCYLFIYF